MDAQGVKSTTAKKGNGGPAAFSGVARGAGVSLLRGEVVSHFGSAQTRTDPPSERVTYQPVLGAVLSKHRGLPRKRRLKEHGSRSEHHPCCGSRDMFLKTSGFAPILPWQPGRCPGKSRVKRGLFFFFLKHILGVSSRSIGHQTAPRAGRTDGRRLHGAAAGRRLAGCSYLP